MSNITLSTEEPPKPTRTYYQVHVILCEVVETLGEDPEVVETDILKEDEVLGHPNDFETLEEAQALYREITGRKP